jgi:hypothetical protein
VARPGPPARSRRSPTGPSPRWPAGDVEIRAHQLLRSPIAVEIHAQTTSTAHRASASGRLDQPGACGPEVSLPGELSGRPPWRGWAHGHRGVRFYALAGAAMRRAVRLGTGLAALCAALLVASCGSSSTKHDLAQFRGSPAGAATAPAASPAPWPTHCAGPSPPATRHRPATQRLAADDHDQPTYPAPAGVPLNSVRQELRQLRSNRVEQALPRTRDPRVGHQIKSGESPRLGP